jgi:hypothetical protein
MSTPLDQIDQELFDATKWEHFFTPAAVLVTADEWRAIAKTYWPGRSPFPMPAGKRTYRGLEVLISSEPPLKRVLLAPKD